MIDPRIKHYGIIALLSMGVLFGFTSAFRCRHHGYGAYAYREGPWAMHHHHGHCAAPADECHGHGHTH